MRFIITKSPYHLIHLRVIDDGVVKRSIKFMYPSSLTRFIENNYGKIYKYDKLSESIAEVFLEESCKE